MTDPNRHLTFPSELQIAPTPNGPFMATTALDANDTKTDDALTRRRSDATRSRNPIVAELGNRLREFRLESGLTGAELAQKAKLTQPTISKIETGRVVTTPEILTRVMRVLRLDADERADLRALLTQATEFARTHRGQGATEIAWRAMLEREYAARSVRYFSQSTIPPLLQTIDYARRAAASVPWCRGTGMEAMYVAMHAQRQSALYRPGRKFEFVITEAALRAGADDPLLRRVCLDRLCMIATLPQVRVGVIPVDAETFLAPCSDFALYDNTLVASIRITGVELDSEPDTVTAYHDAYVAMARAARFDDADHMLRRLSEGAP